MTILICLLFFVFFWCWERLKPARSLDRIPGWIKRVIFINGLQGGVIFLAGITWDKYFQSTSLLNVSQNLSLMPSALLGYFVITFIFYWWHRARHEFDFLWLTCHQLHHSPARLEVITSFYKHPIEMSLNSMIMSATLYSFLGLSHQAVAITIVFAAIAESISTM